MATHTFLAIHAWLHIHFQPSTEAALTVAGKSPRLPLASFFAARDLRYFAEADWQRAETFDDVSAKRRHRAGSDVNSFWHQGRATIH